MMTTTRGAHQRYLVVSYGITWLLWTPVLLASYGLPSFSNAYVGSWLKDIVTLQPTTPAHWLILAGGVLGPLLGAVAAWQHLAGPGGIRRAAGQCFDVRVSDWRGWAAGLLPLGYFALGSLVIFAVTGVTFTSSAGPLAFIGLLAAGCLLITGEEIGWRATQLPLLQEQHTALRSSLIVAVSWACWHIPLLLMWGARGGSILGALMALSPYLVLTIPAAMMHTFAFNSARGLVLVPILFHGLHNHLNAVLTPNPASEEALAKRGRVTARGMLEGASAAN
jgi:membrane protease YdiL (CAAX protease family)